ncbi:alpha/beta fold hydrolase [Luteimonas aquatica]|uniref:alpha/beta fold hydrolase n=1 Tax=Luteimonas aquatica TaxID=450364 RepID=UPI001F579088|nr:alpha/beta hydrolase [Luteimonas aquatica]
MRALFALALLSLLPVACAGPPPPANDARPAATAEQPALPMGERRIAASDGTELYVKVAGQGPVCIFVHGGPGQGSLSFEKMGGQALESFLTLVYLDQRGSGKSANAKDYHLDRVVQDIEEVRQALGVDKPCLIAHSFGGILAVAYAQRHPQHVSRLVMANTSLDFMGDAQRRMQIHFISELLKDDALDVGDDAAGDALAAAHEKARKALQASGNGYRFLSEDKAAVARMSEIDDSYPRTIDYGMAVITGPATLPEYYRDYAPSTATVRVPVLVISGRRDHAVGPAHFRTFRFPDQRVVELDTGHLPYYENTRAFAAAIRDFVAPAP